MFRGDNGGETMLKVKVVELIKLCRQFG